MTKQKTAKTTRGWKKAAPRKGHARKSTSKLIRGTFCEKITNPKRKFDARSFRWITSGHAKILIGCPKGKWQPRKQHCTVGTKAYVILTPAKGKRCPVGSKRITKG